MMLILPNLFKKGLQEIAKLISDSTPEALCKTFNLKILKILKKKCKNPKLKLHRKSLLQLINAFSILEKSKNSKKETNGTVLHANNTNRQINN